MKRGGIDGRGHDSKPRAGRRGRGRRMSRLVLGVFVVVAQLAQASEPGTPAPTSTPTPASFAPGAVGSAMELPELPAIGLPAIGAEQLAGKVVIYEFWATWCTPCRVQVEILKELLPRATAAGVEIVGVATGEPEDLVAAHLAKEPSPYPNLLDREEKLGTAIQVLALPTVVVVDREGRIVWRNTGLSDRSMIERALESAGAPLAAAAAPAPAPGR